MNLKVRALVLGCTWLCLFNNNVAADPTPVVLWHGMGDSCCFSFSMGAIKSIIERVVPDVYVFSVKIGRNEIEDVEDSYFGDINKQVDQVCKQLQQVEKLKQGYNAIGFSQGSQFLRAVAQRCPDPPVKNLISIGGQHQGVYGVPNCGSLENRFCDYLRRMFKYGAYIGFVQRRFIQASYWHDPLQDDEYKKHSVFLADINNELNENQTYKDNLLRLQNLVLVKFEKDRMVTPIESEWFGFYKPGQSKLILTMEETDLYKQDRIGLKKLNEQGKIKLLSVNGNHLQFSDEWFADNIVKEFLV